MHSLNSEKVEKLSALELSELAKIRRKVWGRGMMAPSAVMSMPAGKVGAAEKERRRPF